MANVDWVSYLGAVTGSAGLLLGIFNYWHARTSESRNLRLKLQAALTDLRQVVDGLPSLMNQAKGSYEAVATLHGLHNSSIVAEWNRDWGAEMLRVREIVEKILQQNYSATAKSLSLDELESAMVEVGSLHARAKAIQQKYQDSVATDDKTREQVQANMRARPQAR